MEPFFQEGDIVFYKKYHPRHSSLNVGDIVLLNHPLKKIILIKRISYINRLGIKVTGYNKNNSDDSNLFGLIRKELILGIVTSKLSHKFLKKFKSLFI
tara:strand:- start:759 stop:1052 length:294 start_codon:yes stop_codon:yes gene_type:complete